jgi:hypothetical protein
MSDTDTAAPTAHGQMMEHYFAGDGAKAQALVNQANAEAGIDEAVHNDPTALARMPKAPKAQVSEVDKAVATLTKLGGEHAALVNEWKQTGANVAEELGYAKAAFRDIAATRPDLIAKVDASGLGNDPAVLKLLAQHGRLQAGMMGDFTVSRNNAPSFDQPQQQRAMPRGQSAAQAELTRIYKETPPGSEGYKAKAVQDRIFKLQEMIHGDGPAVGLGGRTA